MKPLITDQGLFHFHVSAIIIEGRLVSVSIKLLLVHYTQFEMQVS